MVEPLIQYARAPDGVRVAFWSAGDGRPLVVMPNTPFSHVQLEWEIAECRDWYERLMAGRRLVRYDARGFGLSDRDARDFSIQANTADLEAVARKAGLDSFALLTNGDMAMVAIAYAVAHPERVSHLIIWCGWACRRDVSGTSQTRTLRALVEQDWQIYTETVARVLAGWQHEEVARQMADFYRQCTTPEVLRVVIPAVYGWDVSTLVAKVAAPVLVLQRRDMPSVPVEVAKDLAAGFGDARLVLLEGQSALPWFGKMEPQLRAIREFLGDEVEPALAMTSAMTLARRASVTVLFTDMESSTGLTRQLGDEPAQELVRTHNRIVRQALRRHGGSEIKHTGDGIMASFASATNGLECAIEIQRAMAAHNEDSDSPFRIRIALNAGEPVEEERDLFGTAVQLAARVRDHAQPGQILVSNVVRELVAGKGFLFADLGDIVLRGFEDPVRIYEVRW